MFNTSTYFDFDIMTDTKWIYNIRLGLRTTINPIMTRPLTLTIIIYAIPDSKLQNDIATLMN